MLFVVGLFSLSATNALLTWHIVTAHGHDHHDSDHCEICQSAFINFSKVIIPPADSVLFVDDIEFQVDYLGDEPVVIYAAFSLIPRAPPV